MELVEPAVQLREQLFDWNAAADQVAVDPAGEVAAFVVVNAQHRVAAPALAETLVGLAAVKCVNEHRDESRALGDDAWIAERTAREVLAAFSARVLAEVHPERLALGTRHLDRGIVIGVPEHGPNRRELVDGRGGLGHRRRRRPRGVGMTRCKVQRENKGEELRAGHAWIMAEGGQTVEGELDALPRGLEPSDVTSAFGVRKLLERQAPPR